MKKKPRKMASNKLLLIIVLLYSIINLSSCDQLYRENAMDARLQITETHVGKYTNEYAKLSLKANQDFSIIIAHENGCTGRLIGKFSFSDPQNAQYILRQCKIKLLLEDNKVSIIETSSCNEFRGISCTFAGEYTK